MPQPTTASLDARRGATLDEVAAAIGDVVLGKDATVRLALCCLLARGHLLIEDQPGVGKTTLAHALALALGLEFRRIQFTSDLLPSDILGVAVYERDTGTFRFNPGPVFCQLVLADEINRATPKAQSALLEAMEERQVSIEGETHRLPDPFFVIATQNPSHQAGTFQLPESQLDRFLMRLHMGYPDRGAERALLRGDDRRAQLGAIRPLMTPAELVALQARVGEVHVSDALLDYVQALLAFSRDSARFREGLSPRAGLGLLRAARAWALMEGRGHAVPEDVQAVLPSVAAHRLVPASDAQDAETTGALIAELVAVPIP